MLEDMGLVFRRALFCAGSVAGLLGFMSRVPRVQAVCDLGAPRVSVALSEKWVVRNDP